MISSPARTPVSMRTSRDSVAGARRCDERADRRQEARVRILGVDARLDRVAVDRELVLRLRQRLAGRDAQLPFDEIEPGDHLGDRMLDLQPRVHLHEVERAVARELSAAMNSTVPAPT